ncbi:universal stress protein [Actinomadura darangshiensis]|uniref:Universal stress protein n=1 Tax=Actinomadura darangshiensis TaxID=705336 RepID=A0A4R5B9E2_9ACTN|nr:universal stress protein [Actinomadura darangshiensis]
MPEVCPGRRRAVQRARLRREPVFPKRRTCALERVCLLSRLSSPGGHRRDRTVIARPDGGPRVVVGVDDSAGARCALSWAVGEARLRRLPLLVAHAAPLPPHVSAAGQLGCGITEALRGSGAELIARLLQEVCGGPPDGVDMSALALVGEPGATLVRLAGDDDILVVGRGTRGPFSRLLRPSVRLHCARRARATLVCVRPPAFDALLESLTVRDESPEQIPGSRFRRLGRRLRLPL